MVVITAAATLKSHHGQASSARAVPGLISRVRFFSIPHRGTLKNSLLLTKALLPTK